MKEVLTKYILTISVLLLLALAIWSWNQTQIEAFNSDIKNVLSDCYKLYPDFDDLPEEVQRIVANMMFNMGRPRLSKFKGMKRGVDAKDWNAAADEMVDSRWYRQVTKRADRLVERMRNV